MSSIPIALFLPSTLIFIHTARYFYRSPLDGTDQTYHKSMYIFCISQKYVNFS
ncbi:hypothetical protein DSUL_30038 [Desulfovibrionales bacterium]